MKALFLIGSLTRDRRSRFFGYTVDGLFFQEGRLAGFVHGMQQFEVATEVDMVMFPKLSMTIWKFRVDGQDWVFTHPRFVRVSSDIQKGMWPVNSSAMSRNELLKNLATLGWDKVRLR
jgi:hypothetical protein